MPRAHFAATADAGAELFQSLLLDHDAAVNLSSWAYVAGVGADPRDRVFKTVTQGERYDPQGQLAAAWLPELSHLPPGELLEWQVGQQAAPNHCSFTCF
jgi:deoxyribodipyrimidine photo-lyase